MVTCCALTPLISGEYGMFDNHAAALLLCAVVVGEPFHFRYWLAQCAVYLLVMLLEKLCVGPLILFDFWSKVSGMYRLLAMCKWNS